jgi:hypothetical protein|tara:strand:- start:294 stop:752 length:459 start_codon:yes stop_codon:yes gene_type:complete
MNKRTLIEIFGLISVIGSLIFVGVEISQNTQAVRGATHQAVFDQVSEYYLFIASEERLADLAAMALTDDIKRNELSKGDRLRLDMLFMTGIRRVENIYMQHKNGILDDDAFKMIGMDSYKSDYVVDIWNSWRSGFDSEFISFFEKLRDGNNP